MRRVILTTLALSAASLSTAQAQDRTGWPSVINFGLIPLEGSSAAEERYKPLFDYIAKTLGRAGQAVCGRGLRRRNRGDAEQETGYGVLRPQELH